MFFSKLEIFILEGYWIFLLLHPFLQESYSKTSSNFNAQMVKLVDTPA
jgi:hypothetical protein